MKDLWNKILLIAIIAMVLALIANEYFATKDKLKLTQRITSLVEDKAALKGKYDSLLYAKQKVTIKYDTIKDTIYILKPRPYRTDTLIAPDSVKQERNYYKGALQDTNILINYKAETLGTLENIELNYKFTNKYTTVESILYIDKPIKVEVWTPKRHLYLYGDAGMVFPYTFKTTALDEIKPSNELYYGLGLMYLTKQNHALKVGYHMAGKDRIYSIGLGLKIF
jgi:hypothetical protein